jgi:hypothetical protein
MSVIGNGTPIDAATTALCEELGQLAVDAGFRLACGGLGGVMAAVARGARRSAVRREGDVVGVLPGYDADAAADDIDIVLPTGLGWARNVLVVAMADVVVAVGGGAGTLSEIAYAWQLGKPIVGLSGAEGWAERLVGQRLDDRRSGAIEGARDPAHAVELARSLTTR